MRKSISMKICHPTLKISPNKELRLLKYEVSATSAVKMHSSALYFQRY